METPETLDCHKCKRARPISAFNRDSSRHNGYSRLCRDCAKDKKQKWRFDRDNAQRELIQKQNHRASRMGIPGTFTFQQWNDLQLIYNHSCAYCGDRPEQLTIDHFWPLSWYHKYQFVPANNMVENIFPVCARCNRAKSDSPPLDFFGWLYWISEER